MTSFVAMTSTSSPVFWILYIVVLLGLMYFMAIRPQQKQKKQLEELKASMEVGDSVKTTSGFYGEIIDITDDMVIVEFGGNKNCRIPMDKEAITAVEKANAAASAAE